MPRKLLTGIFLVLLLVGAIFVSRFDLPLLWLSHGPASPDTKSATDGAKVATPPSPSPAPLSEGDRTGGADPTKFDVARIDPEGASVFAGRAPANAQVTVLANGQPVATAKANADGEWSTVIERPFAAGEHQLSIRAKPSGSGAEVDGQSVRVTIAPTARPTATDPKAVEVARQVPAPGPITFPYDEASLTVTGRKQAETLSDFLRRGKLDAVTLSGHADERGSDGFNMELSRRRLESVARFLREAGYTGKLVLVPKGRQEPFSAVDRNRLPKEDVFQLDRRVELHSKQ